MQAVTRRHREPSEGDTLYAVFDLQLVPIAYDACWFAAGADLVRRWEARDRDSEAALR